MATNTSTLDFKITVQRIEYILIVISNLIDKLEKHTTSDIKDIVLYTLRKIDELNYQLRYGSSPSSTQR
jgi:hypothetical protein